MGRTGVSTRALIPAVLAAALALLASSVPALAAAAHPPRPVVRSLRASRTALSDSGGKVTLNGTVRYASRCEFSSKPTVRGLPGKVGCSSGRATKTVRLPVNSGTTAVAYRFELTATGNGGTSKAHYVTVRVLPPPPTATLSASPDGLIKTGGTATVTATVSHTANCELSVAPAVTGLPVSVPCVAGVRPVSVTTAVALPALTGSVAVPYTFRLTVTGAGGTSAATATETVWPDIVFGSLANAGAGSLTDVSCASPTFCAATDTAGSVALFNGSKWTVPATTLTAPGVALVSVSCTSPRFCMAVDDQNGEYGSGVYVWNGQYWSTTPLPGNYLTSVSCTSPTFCMALGNLNTGVFASLWNGHSWGTQTQVDSPAADVAVSCASTTFCAAVDGNGDAMTFNGTSWGTPDPIDPGVIQPLATVSCPTSTFCTAMDGFGQAFTYDGSAWSSAVGVENSAGVTSVSCTSSSFCVAADLTGNVVTEYDGTWSGPDNIDPQSDSNFYGFTGISCPTVAFCAAVDELGNVARGTG